jgi:molecular chaperone GrpE
MSEEKETKKEGLEEKIAKLEEEKDEYLNGWKRAKADLINYKKEEAQRVGHFVKFSNEVLISELLAIMDSFELSLSVLAETEPAKKGIVLMKNQLEDLLKRHGLERIQVKLGDPFDPHLEEAVGEVNSAEPPGTIAEEISNGFKLHGKVIRPVRIKIAKGHEKK